MKIHVFTSDIIPLRGLPTSGGGLRSWQIISGLKEAGLSVSYSMPSFTFLVKSNDASLTAEEKSLCWSHANQHIILQKCRPQAAIWCSPYGFSLPVTYKSDCVLVVDLHGPTNVESCYISNRTLKDTTRELIEKLSAFDHYITVCEEQRYYFSALLCAAGLNASDIKISVVPLSIPLAAPPKRKDSRQFSMIYCGGFYPWQDPSRILMHTAHLLDALGAHLHICGSAHPNLSSARIDKLLEDLSGIKSVRLYGYVARSELIKKYASASCALDLMPKSLERGLAVTTRTIEYLAYGVPPVYNNYAPLAKYISRYDAGWCMDPDNLKAYGDFLSDLAVSFKSQVPAKSANAIELSRTEFSLQRTVEPLVEFLRSAKPRPSRQNNRQPSRGIAGRRRPRIVVFTQENSFIRQLRVVLPLDAMKRCGMIEGYTIYSNLDEQGPDSFDAYDAIWVQRTVMEPVLRIIGHRPFLFDIDDLLVGRPSYTSVSTFQGRNIESLLGLECTLSLTHGRLHELLKKYTTGKIPKQFFVTPNGFDFSKEALPTASTPQTMIWTSSDAAALTTSYEDIVRAIEQFGSQHNVPVVMIGRFESNIARRLPENAVFYGRMDFWRHKAFLSSQPNMIAVCPLETHADEATLDFIAGKSDLKMVEYGGFGHTGVYSRSVPYTDTNLRTGILAANTFEEWLCALETARESAYKRCASEGMEIRDLRNISRLARENWLPAVNKVLLSKAMTKAEISGIFKESERGIVSQKKRKGNVYEKDVLLFGAGAGGAQTFFSLPPGYNCLAFIDNDLNKQKTRVLGRPVIGPQDISNYHYDAIIISSMFFHSIEEQLIKLGVNPSKIEKAFS